MASLYRLDGSARAYPEGLLPKSIWKDEFHESLIFIPRFPQGSGDSRSTSLQRIGVFNFGQQAPRTAPDRGCVRSSAQHQPQKPVITLRLVRLDTAAIR